MNANSTQIPTAEVHALSRDRGVIAFIRSGVCLRWHRPVGQFFVERRNDDGVSMILDQRYRQALLNASEQPGSIFPVYID